MNAHDFETIFDKQIAYCRKLLVDKATEYASADRLSAFKEAAAMQSTTPQQALAGMMAKHTQSVYKFCRSDEAFPMEKWEEKITDHINYLILLRALVMEEEEKKLPVQLSFAETTPTSVPPLNVSTIYNVVSEKKAFANGSSYHNTGGGAGPKGPRLINDYANLLHQGKLREKRLARGETQFEVGRAIGVHGSSVGFWETGKTIPTQDHYDALVNYFYPYWHKAVQKGLPHGQNTSRSTEP